MTALELEAVAPTTPTRPLPSNTFSVLAKQVRSAGLLERARGFYVAMIASLTLALGAIGVGMVLLGDSWWQLVLAGALGLVLTQFAFVAHEASHQQILAQGAGNERLGQVLANGIVGISHSWWNVKHSAHHANPNKVGKDPDIDQDTISFLEEDAAGRRGFLAALTRRQGYLFFPLLMLEGLNLHVIAIRSLIASPSSRTRTGELVTIALRLSLYVAALFMLFPIGLAFAFLGVQLAVFGVYMGASFAPNHKGMPILSADSKLDFLRKQVLTSRNIRGGWPMTLLMGGLNYQVEHHLFPSMPRTKLARAQKLVRAHCAEHNLPYVETGLIESYGIVIRYLNRVGLAARDPFDCPARQRLGAR
jgi:fatty acid desaturase